MRTRHPFIFAVAFFVFWMLVLLAGADFPPPRGFLWLVPLTAACALAVYWRIPAYVAWAWAREPGRRLRVVTDGVIAGCVAGLVGMFLPFNGEPSVLALPGINTLIWFAVLAAMGVFNTLGLYALVCVFKPWRK